jgi:hypothetical protein
MRSDCCPACLRPVVVVVDAHAVTARCLRCAWRGAPIERCDDDVTVAALVRQAQGEVRILSSLTAALRRGWPDEQIEEGGT